MVTLITGASTGIGAEYARQFAARGDDLVLVARSADKLEALAAQLRGANGVQVTVIPMDLSAPDAAAQLWEQTNRLGLEVTVLVNNAGANDGVGLDKGPEAFRASLDANLVHRENGRHPEHPADESHQDEQGHSPRDDAFGTAAYRGCALLEPHAG